MTEPRNPGAEAPPRNERSREPSICASASAAETRARQQFWTSRGISGVPSMVFDGKYLLTGAQGAQTYAEMLKKVVSEKQAA